MAKQKPIDLYSVSLIYPTQSNPHPLLLLKFDGVEFQLTSAQAVYLAGLLLDGVGQSLEFHDEDHKAEVVQLLTNLFQRFLRPS